MNIAIIDDHLILLNGLKKVVEIMDKVSNIDTYISPIDFLEKYKGKEHIYDLLLIDIAMPEMSGTELISLIRTQNSDQKILVLSMHKENVLIQSLFKLKIDGYISKNCDSEELHCAIDSILRGKKYITEDISVILNFTIKDKEILSSREIEIVQCLCKGLSSKMIADKLFISLHTVNTHRKNIIFKLGLANTAELIKYAVVHKIS